jgi:hypothetical protein
VHRHPGSLCVRAYAVLMAGELQQPGGSADPTQLRISDAERHQVAELLREAAGEGRLDLDELDQRLEATYAARTYADLVPITLDLPTHPHQRPVPARPPAASPDVVPGPDKESHFAILSGLSRKGVWVVPRQMTILAMMGGAELDLRRAKFAAPEVVITINAFMGGAQVIVGPTTRVQMEGTGIMGGYSGPSGLVEGHLDETSPVVRIKGLAIWGGVSVERKHL